MNQIAVRCCELTKHFGDMPAVDGVDFEVQRGETLALLGPSGCGKTTTLRLIAGFEIPDAGSIEIGGRTVAGPTVYIPPERRRVGMVFQDYALFPHLTVRGNVAFGLSRRDPAREDRVRELLDLVGLTELADRYPYELSGGEQQRIALARTLAPNPEVVLLDEPFSNLDAELRRQMRFEVSEILKQIESTVILVTHDQEEAFELGDRVAILNHGRLEQLGTPEEIYTRPATRFVAEFVGRFDVLPGRLRPEGIETEIGLFPAADGCNGDPRRAGEAWEVLIRPDTVELEPDPAGDALVVARRFVGTQKLYCLELPSGRRLHSLQPSTRNLSEGSRVRVIVPRDRAIGFPLNARDDRP